MCTAAGIFADRFCFGRTLDVDKDYGEEIVITPRMFPFRFRFAGGIDRGVAMLGAAVISDNVPLYFDAVNEKGLAGAGLRYPETDFPTNLPLDNYAVAPFEFIPWVLRNCADTKEALRLLKCTTLKNEDFSETLPSTPLHWIFSDKFGSLVVESEADGIKIYDNPTGVLTNSPSFPLQLFNLNNYIGLSQHQPINNFSKSLDLKLYSFGLGALGLPGDLSSMSRFVRAAYYRQKLIPELDTNGGVFSLMTVLGTCFQPKGLTAVTGTDYEYTSYTSCYDTESGILYYSRYGGSTYAVSLNDIHGEHLISFDFFNKNLICRQNF